MGALSGDLTTIPAACDARHATRAQAHRARIVECLPWFAAGWIALGLTLRVGLVARGALPLSVASVSIALQALVLLAAIHWCRRAPQAATVPWVAFGACVGLVLLATGFFARLGGSIEVFVFAVLLICIGSSWAFAWGWGVALVLLVVSAAVVTPVVLTAPALHRFIEPTELLLETALGAAMAVALAEATWRSFVRSYEHDSAARDAARQLAAAYQAYRDLAENARDMIYTHDLDGRITYVNEAFARAYGMPASALVGRIADTLVPRDPENPDLGLLRARLAAGEEIPPQVYWVRGPSGRRWLECVTSAIHDAGGRVVGARGIVRDVTERRRAEDALRASLAELRRSEERLRSLARHQASIREEERKRLGFDLHDDVCQELVGVGILVESLRRRASDAAPALTGDLERIGRYVGEVGEHLRRLARDLRPMLLRDLGLEESLHSLAEGMSTPATIVTIDVRTAIPRLEEETEIGVYRIAQEALTNAARHAAARAIRIVLAVEGGGLELEIVDDGRGFAPTARRGSEALGLVGMEERALALGGHLEVRSAPGEGTRIRLTCPAVPRAAASAA